MKIGKLAKEVGVSTPTIRFYENIGLIPAPKRENGIRKYNAGDLEKLKVIHSARKVGFSLEEVRTLLDGFPMSTSPSARWGKLAEKKLAELENIIEHTKALKYLIESGMTCTCDEIELCLNSEGRACKPKQKSKV